MQRKALRRELGQIYLHDTILGVSENIVLSGNALVVRDSRHANPDFAAEQMYRRSWLRVGSLPAPSDPSFILYELRVASFNVYSGAFLTQQTSTFTLGFHSDFEIHTLISPSDKNRAIDEAVRRVRTRQEFALPSVDAVTFYGLGGVASPGVITDVLDAFVWADPTNTLGRNKTHLDNWEAVTTGSGLELRFSPALGGSQQLVIDAMVAPTLADGDDATTNVPDGEMLLWGAAAQCYWMLEQQTPGAGAAIYKERRLSATRAFNSRAMHFRPRITRKLQLDESW